jgi:hypothetical protein
VTVSPTTPPFLVEAWNLAVRSAGFDPADVYLLPLPRAPGPNDGQAALFHRGLCVIPPQGSIRDEVLAGEANEHIEQHRVAVYTDVPDDALSAATVAGKMRHELRHAEQIEAGGEQLWKLMNLAEAVARYAQAEDTIYGALYNQIPTERDANVTAAMLLAEHYRDQVAGVLAGDDAVIARPGSPTENLLDLPNDLFAFMLEHRAAAEMLGLRGKTITERLREIDPEWAERWERMATQVHTPGGTT